MPILLVTDHPAPTTEIEARLVSQIGGVLRVAVTGDEGELVALAADADAILTCFRQVTPAVVAAAPRLRVIGRYGVGVDNIAVDAASARRIPVTNVPDVLRRRGRRSRDGTALDVGSRHGGV